jgi:glycosyltransferase involved in cell wall biosynthesis
VDVLRQFEQIAGSLRREAFDLIYVNGPRLLPAAAIAARGRIPLVFHAHHRLRQRAAARIAGWGLRRSRATVVACSDFAAKPWRQYTADHRVHIVSNGSPDFGFHVRAFDSSRPWRIGVIGRISPEKGQAEFLRAAALLRCSNGPAVASNARFVICGAALSSDRAYSDRVQALARGLPVDFLGWRDDVASVLEGLDLLVVPSIEEGQSRATIEALSMGVPVVASAVGGIPEMIQDGVTGFLVRPGSPEALAARIVEVTAMQPDKLREVAGNARRAWERGYTLAMFRERVTKLMRDVASAPLGERGIALPQLHR